MWCGVPLLQVLVSQEPNKVQVLMLAQAALHADLRMCPDSVKAITVGRVLLDDVTRIVDQYVSRWRYHRWVRV